MAVADIGLGLAKGLAGASGDEATANRAQYDLARNDAIRQDERNRQAAPLLQSIAADQQRLSILPPDSPEHDSILSNMALTIGKVRNVYGDKTPAEDPSRLSSTINGIRQHLHLGGKTAKELAQAQSEKVDQFWNQNRALAGEYANAALPFAETAAGQLEAAKFRDAQILAGLRGTMREYQSPDGKARDWFHPGTQPEGWQAMAGGAKGGYIRNVNHIVTLSNALSLMENVGTKFPKQDGSDWTPDEIAKIPAGMVLAAFIKGNQTFYAPFDQHTKTAIIGNEVYQIPEGGVIEAGTANPLGPKNVGSTTIDPMGVESTTVPHVTGMTATKPPSPPREATAPIPVGPKARALRQQKDAGVPKLDANGHIPSTAGNPYLVEAANQLLDGMDINKLNLPQRDKQAAALLAAKYGWSQGTFTPKDKVLLRESATFIKEASDNKALDVLNDPASRAKLAILIGDVNREGSLHRILGVAVSESATPEEIEFLRLYNQLVGTISGLAQLTRSGRVTEATIGRLMQELPNPITTQSAADAKQRLRRLKNELTVAEQTGKLNSDAAGDSAVQDFLMRFRAPSK